MTRWLAAAVTLGLLGSSGAQAQMKSFASTDEGETAHTRTVDLRMPQPALMDAPQTYGGGMLVRRELGSNTAIGVGLAKVYGKRRGLDLSTGERTVRTRKPAVTFLLKF